MDTPMHSVAMVGVVERDGRVLCIERADNGRWEPPAGVLERDETFQECVQREVLEETGVLVQAVKVTGLYKNMKHDKRPVTMVWLCRYVGGEAHPTDEATDVRWLGPEEIHDRVPTAHELRITDALAHADEVRVRYHDGTRLLDDESQPVA